MAPILALAMLAAAPYAVVLRPVANMYRGPSRDTDVVSQAIYGVSVSLTEEKAGWAKIETPDQYTGWMQAEFLRHLKTDEARYASGGHVAQVESLFANIYREPSVTKHEPLLTVPFETRLEVIAEPRSEESRWLQIRLVDDRQGWVQRGDVTMKPETLSIDGAIALARRFLGLPYTWGGTSSFGYDCSGFMQMLCRRRGVVTPRDAGPQAAWYGVVPVAKDQLRAGDLLYFGSSEKRITHTGMYIGDDRFIHATTHEHPVVQISRLSDSHWTKLLVAARRLK